jgi:hypothetical protein
VRGNLAMALDTEGMYGYVTRDGTVHVAGYVK